MFGSVLSNRILALSLMICIALCSAKTLTEVDVVNRNISNGIMSPLVPQTIGTQATQCSDYMDANSCGSLPDGSVWCYWCKPSQTCMNTSATCNTQCTNCIAQNTAASEGYTSVPPSYVWVYWCVETQTCQSSGNCITPITGGCLDPYVNSDSCYLTRSCSDLHAQLTAEYNILVGWCWDTNACVRGNISGPFVGSCSQWQFITEVCGATFPWYSVKIVIGTTMAALSVIGILLFLKPTAWIDIGLIPPTKLTLRTAFGYYGPLFTFIVKKVVNTITFTILVISLQTYIGNPIPFTAGVVALIAMCWSTVFCVWLILFTMGVRISEPTPVRVWTGVILFGTIELAAFLCMMIRGTTFLLVSDVRTVDIGGIDIGGIIAITVSGITSLSSHVFAIQLLRSIAVQKELQKRDGLTSTLLELEEVVEQKTRAFELADPIPVRMQHLALNLKRWLNLLVLIGSVTSTLFYLQFVGFGPAWLFAIAFGGSVLPAIYTGVVLLYLHTRMKALHTVNLTDLRFGLMFGYIFLWILQIGGVCAPILYYLFAYLAANPQSGETLLTPNMQTSITALIGDCASMFYFNSCLDQFERRVRSLGRER